MIGVTLFPVETFGGEQIQKNDLRPSEEKKQSLEGKKPGFTPHLPQQELNTAAGRKPCRLISSRVEKGSYYPRIVLVFFGMPISLLGFLVGTLFFVAT